MKDIKIMTALYDMIRNELWEKHSISALLYLLNGGRELEFVFSKRTGSITWIEKKIYLYVEEMDNQIFDTPWDMISKGKIDGKSFFELWNEIEIKVLF